MRWSLLLVGVAASWGFVSIIAAALTYALLIVGVKSITAEVSPFVLAFWQYVVVSAALAPGGAAVVAGGTLVVLYEGTDAPRIEAPTPVAEERAVLAERPAFRMGE